MLWAPFPVSTYWLPHTHHATKWIIPNSFNQSSETLKSLFYQKHPARKQTTKHVNVRSSQLGPRPSPAAPSRRPVPGARVPAHTPYPEDRGLGGLLSLTPQPDPPVEKQPARSDTDNSPHFQGNSENREARPRMRLIWMCFQKSPKLPGFKDLRSPAQTNLCVPGPSSCYSQDGRQDGKRALQLQQHRWFCLSLLFSNIKERKEIETHCQKSEFCRKQFSNISRALIRPLKLWPRDPISAQPKERITLGQEY